MRTLLETLMRTRLSSRRFGVFLCLLGFVWGITLIQLTLFNYQSESRVKQETENLQADILKLSGQYVRQLASEDAGVLDTPYAGKMTAYDMKKTLAVLLDSLMRRIDTLESKIEYLQNGSARKEAFPLLLSDNDANNRPVNVPGLPDKVDFKGLIQGKLEECLIKPSEKQEFPHCEGKMAWMKAHWKSDPCYAEYGVDGTDCTSRVYLSEVENWCPLLPGRKPRTVNVDTTNATIAPIRKDLPGLMTLLKDPGPRKNYEWIRDRISRMWPIWTSAIESLSKKQDLKNRQQKKILVHLGLLTKQSGFKIAEGASRGGPLGELVQWSDIISSLYLLGHELIITSEVEQLTAFLKANQNLKSSCPMLKPRHESVSLIVSDIMGLRQFKRIVKSGFAKYRILSKLPTVNTQCQTRERLPIDIIISDIIGLNQFRRKVKAGYGKFSCLLRIVDSFGTEPSFNFDQYAKTHGMKTQWGMQNLIPQQFFTMFPHTPDNSFMGFVVDHHAAAKNTTKKNQAVVYGKADYMWQNRKEYLDIIKEFVEVHATVYSDAQKGTKNVPSYVKNHGILSGQQLHQLLQESKLFIGLGFPYEGPAPLEAIAQGCVFINPLFVPPHNSANTKFFKGKPTLRQVTSQHPYTEDYMGEPHVRTIDISKPEVVRKAIQEAMKDVDEGRVTPYMPYEYTAEGMIQRLNSYVQHQDFCTPKMPLWPPEESVQIVTSKPGQNCKLACKEKNLICEPSHFKRVNTKEELEKHIGTCTTVDTVEDIFYPSFNSNTKQCLLQKQSMLYSCVGEAYGLSRVCPCRDYIKGQTALCSTCL